MAIKVEVFDGEIGLNDEVLWYSDSFGIRSGKVIKITEKLGNRSWNRGIRSTSVTVKSTDKRSYGYTTTLTRLDRIIPNRSVSDNNTITIPQFNRA